ncbi:hypothetical protein YYC_01824 [Plasmodium yoelii 17X]|uniref:Uncharacterized protein n=1 Tax=Plasmodium yoelii 17X TaxID=1323249 RepID=V7PR94_PLAYE|nr:hypothetical protein YYC_01824 [Plasmodium yoelii 17X]
MLDFYLKNVFKTILSLKVNTIERKGIKCVEKNMNKREIYEIETPKYKKNMSINNGALGLIININKNIVIKVL